MVSTVKQPSIGNESLSGKADTANRNSNRSIDSDLQPRMIHGRPKCVKINAAAKGLVATISLVINVDLLTLSLIGRRVSARHVNFVPLRRNVTVPRQLRRRARCRYEYIKHIPP